MRALATVFVILGFAGTSGAANYAAMNDVPVQGGELRLSAPVEIAMADGDGDEEVAEVVAFPLRHTEVAVEIAGVMAQVTIEQTFENPFAEPIEAVYVFPLGDEAAVNEYEIVIGERVIKGTIKKAAEARQTYEDARDEGRTAGLLEQQKANIFQQSVANIPPGEPVKVRFTYVELLEYDNGSYEFVYPMVVGPRYLPSSTNDPRPVTAHVAGHAPVKGATSIPYVQSAQRSGHDIDLEVFVDAGVPISNLEVPSHRVNEAAIDETGMHISLAADDRIPNKDFVLRYDTAGQQTLVGLLSHRDEGDGYFTLVVQPKADYRTADITAREIMLLIDVSGSMSGQPLELAKGAARTILANLAAHDTFNIVTFASGVEQMNRGPIAATEANKRKGMAYVDALTSGGGTEMLNGVARSLKRKPGDDQVRMVYIMTDGFIGNDGAILTAVQKKGGHNRIFPLGIGSSPNRYLLDRLGEIGRGFTTYLMDGEPNAERVASLVERTRFPYLTDVEIDWNGLKVRDLTPEVIPDVYAGKPLVIAGRYDKPGKEEIEVKARLAGRDVETRLAVELPKQVERPAVSYLWARRRIKELNKQNLDGNDEKVKKSITDLGLKFHLVTDYTSFVAVDETRVVSSTGRVRTVNQPVPIPEGTQWSGVFGPQGDGSTTVAAAPSYNPPSSYTPTAQSRSSHHRRHRSRPLFGGGGGAIDPVTLITVLTFVPLARTLRRRRRKDR